MPADEARLRTVGEWVKYAEDDLTNAAHTLKLASACPTRIVAFHAQQCVEKYLKALLIMEGIDFPKTHNIEHLVYLVPIDKRPPSLSPDEQSDLTEYATGARYPFWGEVSLSDARHAIAIARKVRAEIRRHLPAAAKRKKP